MSVGSPVAPSNAMNHYVRKNSPNPQMKLQVNANDLMFSFMFNLRLCLWRNDAEPMIGGIFVKLTKISSPNSPLLKAAWSDTHQLSPCFLCSQGRRPLRADAHRSGVKVWPLETARNLGVTSANGFRNAGRKSTRNACPGKVIRL
jgi:hypothetical protein